MCRKYDLFEMNFKFATALNRLPISLHTFAPISELPFNISYMPDFLINKVGKLPHKNACKNVLVSTKQNK